MNREFLKELGVGAEAIDNIMAEYGKSFKDYEKKNSEIVALKQQVADLNKTIVKRDSQLDELKKVDGDGLKATIEKLQGENKMAKEKYDKALQGIKVNHAVDSALYKANAKNIKAAKALLDMEKVSFDGENIVGLADQIESLMDDANTSFMFGEKDTHKVFGAKPAEGKDNSISSVKSEYERAKLAYEKKPTFENSVALSRAKIESEN